MDRFPQGSPGLRRACRNADGDRPDRRAAKAARNFAEADRIRAELAARGVTLIDTKDGTTYRIG